MTVFTTKRYAIMIATEERVSMVNVLTRRFTRPVHTFANRKYRSPL